MFFKRSNHLAKDHQMSQL